MRGRWGDRAAGLRGFTRDAEVKIDTLVDALDRQGALYLTERRHGNLPGFFTDDERETIGFFGDADARAMTCSHVAGDRGVHAQRQEAGRGGDTILLHDHR